MASGIGLHRDCSGWKMLSDAGVSDRGGDEAAVVGGRRADGGESAAVLPDPRRRPVSRSVLSVAICGSPPLGRLHGVVLENCLRLEQPLLHPSPDVLLRRWRGTGRSPAGSRGGLSGGRRRFRLLNFCAVIPCLRVCLGCSSGLDLRLGPLPGPYGPISFDPVVRSAREVPAPD
jgi:hypothetical protein